MSTISDALKTSQEAFFLVDIDFDGMVKRWSTKNINVPYSGHDAVFYEGLLAKVPTFGSSLNLSQMRYSISDATFELINKDRLQDEEKRRRLDGSIGTVRIWCDGLTWADIDEEGIIFRGAFQKKGYNKKKYSFALEELSKSDLYTIPAKTINTDTWSGHRTEGGGGSVAGKCQPLVFGDWAKGIPLLCVDTTDFIYLAMTGISDSADAEYTATTENVYDKDGAVIDAANYTFYPGNTDEEGNPVACFDFTGTQAASEPLSCSICGVADGSGEITGTAGTLIEHPADIVHYLKLHHSKLDPDYIDERSLKTMQSLLPGYKFASYINSQTAGVNIVDRILSQSMCARTQRPYGKLGVMVFDTTGPPMGIISEKTDTIGTPEYSSTDLDSIVNNIEVQYALNPSTGKYEGTLTKDKTNNTACKLSALQYGDQPKKTITYPDIQDTATAEACISRYLSIHAFRHDIAEIHVPYYVGFDLWEGDQGLLTLTDGPSHDGAGWSEEPFILLERKFNKRTIYQKWWRIGVN